MTDEEGEELFLEINRILREGGLNWLAAEIEAEAAEGRPAPKMLSVFEEYDSDAPSAGKMRRPTRRREEFTHVVPFTSKEKLEISIEALRAIVLSAPAILEELKHTLTGGDHFTVSFVSETDQPRTTISDVQAAPLTAASAELRRLLDSLSTEVKRDT